MNVGVARRGRNIRRRYRLDVRRRLIDGIRWPWDAGWLFNHAAFRCNKYAVHERPAAANQVPNPARHAARYMTTSPLER